MTQTPTATQENRNMLRLYHDLMMPGDISTKADYNPLGEWFEVAADLYNTRMSEGPQGVRSHIAKLHKSDNTMWNKLTTLAAENPAQSMADKGKATPIGILLSDVQPQEVDWLWHRRLALGKLSLLDGDPGLGKTTMMLDIAARLSRGWAMPDDNSPPIKGGVVIVSLEDGLEDTLQPRLARAGADLTKIVSIGYFPALDPERGAEYERAFCLSQDMPVLEGAIDRVNAKLVIIDPIMAVIGNKDTYKDNEVRAALAPLKALAEQKKVSVAMIRHFTKSGGDHAIYRGGGSIAFIGLARTGLMMTRDPEDENKCVLANIKNNLAPLASNLTYSIVSDADQNDNRPYIKWEGINSYSVQELLSAPKNGGANRQEILRVLREKAPSPMSPQEILRALIEDNPELEQNNVNVTLSRMREVGQVVSKVRGQYSLPST